MSSAGISGLLEKLGFKKSRIVETIVTTLNPDGTVNPAPMGISRGEGLILIIKPFKTSNTYRNLLKHPIACINITSVPSFYLQTAFKDTQFIGLHQPRFNGVRMEQADAYIILKKIDEKKLDESRVEFHFEIQGIERKNLEPKAFSRGDASLVDAIIHITRLEAFINQGKLDDARKARERFYLCKEVVNRVSKSEVILELSKLVDEWSIHL